MVNKTSMLYWWPRVEDLPIPMPKTKIILNKGQREWIKYLDEGNLTDEEDTILMSTIYDTGLPCFMRTDLYSGKHSYLNTCHVKDSDKANQQLFNLIDKSISHDKHVEAIVIREHLELIAPFKAFIGLPIAKERRYFAEEGRIAGHHPYWPVDAMVFNKNEPVPADWQEKLHQINIEDPGEITMLSEYASLISQQLDGAWSLDFAQAINGTWYFIDAAEAIQSWIDPEYAEQIKW
jgi:hypothetical protein